MTNLLCTISVVLVTNWQTVSITRDVGHQTFNRFPGATTLEYHQDWLNQVGLISTNTMADIPWAGRTNRVLIHSEPERKILLERSGTETSLADAPVTIRTNANVFVILKP